LTKKKEKGPTQDCPNKKGKRLLGAQKVEKKKALKGNRSGS